MYKKKQIQKTQFLEQINIIIMHLGNIAFRWQSSIKLALLEESAVLPLYTLR